MADVITIKNLVKGFGDFTALDRVSLDIKKGEVFGLLGPNGAGKTTTINIILGLLKPTSGTITVNGMDIAKHEAEIKGTIGHMTQETVVEGDLTARQNLEIFARLYSIPDQEIPKRVEQALRDSELKQFEDKKAGTFSGGMQRRLGIVKAMIQRPEILILDEPTTGLDVQNRINMWQRIKELNHAGVTILLTTQYLEEADALCDRIAIIDHGRVKSVGNPTELKQSLGKGRIIEITAEERDIPTIKEVLKTKFKLEPTYRGGRLTATVDESRIGMLVEITETLRKRNVKLLSISLHLPTLDDVFIKLTGSTLRDTLGENQSGATKVLVGRGAR